MVNIWRYS